MIRYGFYNNKGGTGKTSLIFQSICRFAKKRPKSKILAIDMCPQANLSELFLGGLNNQGSSYLLERQGMLPRCSIGGYFQWRLPSPYSMSSCNFGDYITTPFQYNENVPSNIDLVCGDPLLELQANAINTLANTQVPGTNTWIAIIDWLNDALKTIEDKYDAVFIDANPSFSIYTQIALSTTDRLVLPVMADDSSRRAIQNAFSLIYGLKLPSEIYTEFAFATRLRAANRVLPKVHIVAKNRLTQYMGPASAYSAVLRSIEDDILQLVHSNPDMFTNHDLSELIVDIRDFQTTGVVAFARGCPFYNLSSGKLDVGGRRVQVKEDYRVNCVKAIDILVDRL